MSTSIESANPHHAPHSRRQAKPMLGDIVTPKPYDVKTGAGHGPLTSGAERYDAAVVVRVNPFALVSFGTDMLWECTVERCDFDVVTRASPELFAACRKRITYSLTNRRVKREASKARRRLRGGLVRQ